MSGRRIAEQRKSELHAPRATERNGGYKPVKMKEVKHQKDQTTTTIAASIAGADRHDG
jgi:hypothetical protein